MSNTDWEKFKDAWAAEARRAHEKEQQMTTYTQTKYYWCGECVDGLPREKLLEIIAHLLGNLEQTRKTLNATIEIHKEAARRRAA